MMVQTDTPQKEPENTKRRRLITILLTGTTVLLLLAAVLIILDPFRLHIFDRLQGKYDAALTAVPAHSDMYVGLNLLSNNRGRLGDIQETFSAATAGSNVDNDELRREMDDFLSQELGISLDEDIVPWLGQFVGFAIVDFELDGFGDVKNFEWVLTIETRDRVASDQFLTKLASGWSTSNEEAAGTETYNRVTITRFEDFVFGRSSSIVLFASSAGTLHQAIDAQEGDSLADTGGYEEALLQLPGDRLLTAYFNGEQLNKILSSVPTILPRISPENLPTASIQGTAVAFSLVDAGIQIDSVTVYDPEQLTANQRKELETRVIDPQTAGILPANTLVYLTGQGIDLIWNDLRRSLIAELGRADFEESMRLFSQEFNINLDEALFPYLDGEATLAFFQGDKGALASMESIGLEAAILIKTGDQETLQASLASFSDKIGQSQGGLGSVTVNDQGAGQLIYEFDTVLLPDFIIAYGVKDGYFLLGSTNETLQSLHFEGGPSLAEQAGYRNVWQAFPEDMSPGLFVDLIGLMSVVRESRLFDEAANDDLTAVLQPIPYIAMASRANGNFSQSRLIIFINTD